MIETFYIGQTPVAVIWTQGLVYDFFYPLTDNSKNHKGGISNVKFSYNTFSK
jgi:hypothetical protein